MIRASAITTSLAILALAPTSAYGSTSDDEPDIYVEAPSGYDTADNGTYGYDVTIEDPGTEGSESPESSNPDPRREPKFTMSYPMLTTDWITGEPCQYTQYIIGTHDDQRPAAAEVVRLSSEAYVSLGGTDGTPACSSTNIDPGEIAQRALENISGVLDTPQPYLQPNNRAITGMRSHLDTGMERGFSETVTVTLFGRDWDVLVTGSGTHTIDWGDGTVDSGVTADGGSWHDGSVTANDIVHHYADAGTYTLTVTTDWTVTAELVANGTSRSQSATTTSAPVIIDVDEVRSVREN